MKTSGASPEAPTRLVLDTSAYSRFRAGDSRVLDLIAAAELVLVPATVLGELHGAFEFGTRARENRTVPAEFLNEPFVRVVQSPQTSHGDTARSMRPCDGRAARCPWTTCGSRRPRWIREAA